MPAIGDLRVDSERLYASVQALGRIGAYRDAETGLKGVNRLALSAADGEARRQLVARMVELGLEVEVDPIGNVYGLRPGSDPALAPLLIGSHIDSVPTAGKFDGCLGVLSGLEIVRVLRDADLAPRRSLVVSFFTEEEGCRFGTDMLGSAVATGRIGLQEAYALRDRDGVSVREALEAIGFLGGAPLHRPTPRAFLELHIEQGPVLAAGAHEVGVVSGVQAIRWQEVQITGRSAHAGTTPMNLRRDAGLAAARVNVALREMCASGAYGGMRATCGVTQALPGRINIVPASCRLSVDLRNLEDQAMAAVVRDLEALYTRIESEEGVHIERRVTAETGTVAFDPALRGSIDGAAARLGLDRLELVSGAGHDAQEWARLCPAGMVFVPGENEGISHNPREYSSPEQCAAGANVLLQVALELLDEREDPPR